MLRGIAGVCVLAIAPVLACAEGTLAFEVASVKPAAPQPPGRLQISMGGDPGRINYTSVSLKNLIERAYSVKSYQVTGPDWMDSERFDVTAKLPDGAKQSDVPQMLQALLAERFKLTIHREQKSMPVYAIVVGKAGVKMPKVEGDALPGPGPGAFRMQMGAKGRQLAGKVTMDNLAGMLSRMLDRPVLDMTELKETYDMKLEWTPDEREGGMRMLAGMPAGDHPPASEGSESSSAPGLFAAVQEQLGLKLETRKGDVAVVVVDSVEKAPTQN